MKDDKLLLYESLVRASLILIFIVSLSVGTVGLVVISRMLMEQAVANTPFPATDKILAGSVR
jgi:hypothetical protein